MQVSHNFLPQQYIDTNRFEVNHNYLPEQFSDYPEILAKIGQLVQECDFTLGKHVDEFENRICEITGSKYTIGVGSGTDALFLSLVAAGIQPGDEIITTPYTFFATIGAIVTAGGRPVFVDVADDYNINVNKIESAITEKTKAILPVHWAGLPCNMEAMLEIAKRHHLFIVEDACHAIRGNRHDKPAGTFGLTGCFSMHPLKNLNVWGDGGYIVTDSDEIHEKLVLLRNHGLLNRNECQVFGYNSRLDSLQAVVANHLLNKIDLITDARINNASLYDALLSDIPQLTIPHRPENTKQVYHLYVIRAEKRDELKKFLNQEGIDAKIHYPIPMHLQPAAKQYGYTMGDFPNCESICDSVLSLPVHEFIHAEQINYVSTKIREFYA